MAVTLEPEPNLVLIRPVSIRALIPWASCKDVLGVAQSLGELHAQPEVVFRLLSFGCCFFPFENAPDRLFDRAVFVAEKAQKVGQLRKGKRVHVLFLLHLRHFRLEM